MDVNCEFPDILEASLAATGRALPDPSGRSENGLGDNPPAFLDVFQQIIDGLPEEIALLDEQWNILAVNDSWRKTVELLGYPEAQPGINYLHFCRSKAMLGSSPADVMARNIAEIEDGIRTSFRFSYHGRERWKGRTFEVCVKRIQILGRTFAITTRHDVTELVELRHLREDFSQSLIEGQAEERRRLAREIHDSTMQLLAALGLAMGQLKRARQSNDAVDILAEMDELLGAAQLELRTISYLAHPPLLEEMGLGEAVQALAEGFGRRTGLAISLHADDTLDIGSHATEVALYRVVQEALSNIHRHAHASDATIVLTRRRRMIHAVVADNGIGMPTRIRHGVGLQSMRARLSELGGRLRVFRHGPFGGTMLVASLLVPDLELG